MTDAEQIKAKIDQMLNDEDEVFHLLMKAHEIVNRMVADSQLLGLDAPMVENALQLVADNLVSCDVQLDMVNDQLQQFHRRL